MSGLATIRPESSDCLTLAAMSKIEQRYRGCPARVQDCPIVERDRWPQSSGIRDDHPARIVGLSHFGGHEQN